MTDNKVTAPRAPYRPPFMARQELEPRFVVFVMSVAELLASSVGVALGLPAMHESSWDHSRDGGLSTPEYIGLMLPAQVQFRGDRCGSGFCCNPRPCTVLNYGVSMGLSSQAISECSHSKDTFCDDELLHINNN